MTDETTEPETDETTEPEPETDETTKPETDEEAAEDETPEPAALSEKELEAMNRQLDAEAKRHRDALDRIMGEDALALVPCAVCGENTAGFHFPANAYPDGHPTRVALETLGEGMDVTLANDDEAETCDRCTGFGETVTGSHVPGQETRPCTKCGAKGWTSAQDRQTWKGTEAVRLAASAVPPVTAVAPLPADDAPQFDQYGRPRGHEFYGRSEAYMSADERARDPYVPKG